MVETANGEECDDGNMDDNDGCTNCKIDHGYKCTTVNNTYSCNPTCGDGTSATTTDCVIETPSQPATQLH